MPVPPHIEKIIDNILPSVTALRHKIHSNPELAGKEFSTSELIRETLAPTKIKLLKPYLETDVVGVLEGGKPGKCVGLRADIDALPLQEMTGLPYRSRNDGVMHACGHDGHTAILLGAAMALNEIRDSLKGSVKFIFQPGEEIVALGKELVEAGVLKSPEVDAVFALHGFSDMPVGLISSRSGAIMAAAAHFKIRIIGKGGHCSKPEACIDPIVIGSQVVNQLQTIVARRFGPLDVTCLSICRFSGGFNGNIIPGEVILEGSTRFLDYEVGKQFPELIENTVKGVCLAGGAKYEFVYDLSYIPTVNTPEYVDLAEKTVTECLGKEMWFRMEKPFMVAEDFAYYLRERPGTFCNLGLGEGHTPVHNPAFDFEDKALRNGIIFMVMMVLKTMEPE
ncbi:MAG: M20 family metallopeptidase [Victivallaceae bacterium]|nr:M20 family metallopeptidase [Victivallaceae bacterium]